MEYIKQYVSSGSDSDSDSDSVRSLQELLEKEKAENKHLQEKWDESREENQELRESVNNKRRLVNLYSDKLKEFKEDNDTLKECVEDKRKIIKLFSNRLKEFKEENTQLKEYITDLEEAGSSSDSEKSSADTFKLEQKVKRLENELKLEVRNKNQAIDMAEEAIIENKAHILENGKLQYHLKARDKALKELGYDYQEDFVNDSEIELGMDEEGNIRIFEKGV